MGVVRPKLRCDVGTPGIDCVYLTRCGQDFEVLSRLLRRAGIAIGRARTLEEADFLLIVSTAAVLVVEAVFPDGTWRDAARMLLRVHPSVGLVVIIEPMTTAPDALGLEQVLHHFVPAPVRLGALRRAILSTFLCSGDTAARRQSVHGASGL